MVQSYPICQGLDLSLCVAMLRYDYLPIVLWNKVVQRAVQSEQTEASLQPQQYEPVHEVSLQAKI